jgi:hypothetical protein
MGAVKDLYFAEMERKFNDLLDQGMDEDAAYEKASNDAYNSLGDKMADLADQQKQRMKDEGSWPPKQD